MSSDELERLGVGRYPDAALRGDVENGSILAGQVAGLVNRIQPAHEIVSEVIREAAKLCALHSASKHSALVPVDYTLRKYVVKRRGSAPGTVQYTHEKTLHVEPGL